MVKLEKTLRAIVMTITIFFAWPLILMWGGNYSVVGYLMDRIDPKKYPYIDGVAGVVTIFTGVALELGWLFGLAYVWKLFV